MISRNIVALGADIKSQWLIAKGKTFLWGPQIGDLSRPENYEIFRSTLVNTLRKERIHPGIIAHDLHPGYFSTQVAQELCRKGGTVVAVQHHHAHIASIICEHKLKDPVIGVAFDGTGYGADKHTWGGEFLLCEGSQFKRLAHLRYVKMPGGDKVVAEPWRMVLSILGSKANGLISAAGKKDIQLVSAMLAKDINCPLTSSAGRLFDAAAALLGICQLAQYEAQGPIKLEEICQKDLKKCYDFKISNAKGVDVIDTVPVFEAILKDVKQRKDNARIATKFHNTFVEIIVKTAKKISKKTGVKDVALSGGVFQNKYLRARTIARLEKSQFRVFSNQEHSVNDYNIALGQYYVSSRPGKS